MSAVQVLTALAQDRDTVNLLIVGHPLRLVVCRQDGTGEAGTHSPLPGPPPPSPLANQELVSATVTRLPTGEVSTSDLQVLAGEDGEHVVVFSPKASEKEDYLLSVLCRGEHVEGSPFLLRCVLPRLLALDRTAERSAIVDAGRPVNLVLPLDRVVAVGGESGEVSGNMEGPSGSCEVAVSLHTTSAAAAIVGRDCVSVRFVPKEAGAYSVCVTRGGEELSESPCLILANFGVEEALKCHILPEDQWLFEQTLSFSPADQTSQSFHISTKEVSRKSRHLDDLAVHCSGPAEAQVTLSSDPEGVDRCEVVPSAPGDYRLNILWWGQHIRGSPHLLRFREGRINSSGLCLDQQEFLLGVPHHFTLNCSELDCPSSEVMPEVTCSSDTACEIDVSSIPEIEGCYRCRLLPLQMGTHDIVVRCQGRHISGSPFHVQFKDPLNTPAPSSPSENAATSTPSEALAPSDPPSPSITPASSENSAPSNSAADKISAPSTPPAASLASPLAPSSSDPSADPPPLSNPSACRLVGGSADYRTGGTLSFKVSTQEAGPGTLAAIAKDPHTNTTIPLTTTRIAGDLYRLDFDPGDRPLCDLCVTFDGRHIPGSPFRLTLSDPNRFKLSGEGLVGGRVGEWNTFVLTPVVPSPGELQVRVERGDGLKAKSDVVTASQDRFKVRYLPPVSGNYKIWVKWGQIPVPGSPFSVRCFSTLYQVRDAPRRVCAGMPLEFKVQLVGGGCPELDESPQVICRTSNGRSRKGNVSLINKDQHIYHCSLAPRKPGTLMVGVIWNKIHIQGSPFAVKVLAPPRPELVRVHGAGVEEGGVVGAELPFTVETGQAGGGTLAIKVQGPSRGLRFETCPDPSDKRTLHATYHPTVPGRHAIEVEWAGRHVPGSPFRVQVVRRGHEEGAEASPGGVVLDLGRVAQGEVPQDGEEAMWVGQGEESRDEVGDVSEEELPSFAFHRPPRTLNYDTQSSGFDDITSETAPDPRPGEVQGGHAHRESVNSPASSVSSCSLHLGEQLDARRGSEDQISIQLEEPLSSSP